MEKPHVKEGDLAEFVWESREEGFTALEHEVIFRELCSGCGLCVAVCPEDVVAFGEYPKLIGKCTNCGYCLMLCPRSFLPKAAVEEKIFGEVGEEMGVVEGLYSVKSKEHGQDGGFVTALLKYMLKKGLIDGALVSQVDPEKPWKPLPSVATTVGEVAEASGSRYSTSPSLSALDAGKKKGLKKIAVVGTPCHIDGVVKLKNYPIENVDHGNLIKHTISVFCKSNFIYSMISDVVEKREGIDLGKVDKFDIKGRDLIVFFSGKEKKILLKDIQEYVRLGCKICDDFTGRFADFAVGSVDSPSGYSTVITRTKDADHIIMDMKKEGLIEVKKIAEDEMPVTKKLSENKKKSAKKKIRALIAEELPMPLKFLLE